MSNVISFEEAKKIEAEAEAQIEAERAAIDAFNLVYSRFLRAKAKVVGPVPKRVGEHGDAYEAYMGKISSEHMALIGELTQTQAVCKYQIAHKFEVLNDLLDHDDTERVRALAQSIHDDVRNLDYGIERAGCGLASPLALEAVASTGLRLPARRPRCFPKLLHEIHELVGIHDGPIGAFDPSKHLLDVRF
jgi:hypothetical protein